VSPYGDGRAAARSAAAIARILGGGASSEEWDSELVNAETTSGRNATSAGAREEGGALVEAFLP